MIYHLKLAETKVIDHVVRASNPIEAKTKAEREILSRQGVIAALVVETVTVKGE